MKSLSKLNYKTLYGIWAGLFALTAVLGLVFPSAGSRAGRLALGAVSLLFFLPPWLILAKAGLQSSPLHRRIIRYLAIASLTATVVLICAGILSVGISRFWGDVLHVLLTILCAPLVCSNFYVLPLFGWATLLVGSFAKQS